MSLPSLSGLLTCSLAVCGLLGLAAGMVYAWQKEYSNGCAPLLPLRAFARKPGSPSPPGLARDPASWAHPAPVPEGSALRPRGWPFAFFPGRP